MTPKAAQRTAEDYRSLPNPGLRYQLIQGELRLMSPSPNRYHQEISRNIEVVLGRFLERHPIGKVYDAPFDVYLGEHDVFQPDLLFVGNDRLGILTDEGANGAPTLVIEILSPSTALMDRTVKKEVYALAGVEELWLVDPEDRRVEVYRLQEAAPGPVAVHGETEHFSSACLPGLTLSCAAIFRR